MKKEIINILTLSKGRMKSEAENIFKKNKLKITQESERSLIGSIKGYPNIRILYMNATEIVEALGKGIGDCDITTVKYYNEPKSIWETLGFENQDTGSIGNPTNPRYWKNIIPTDYSIFNRQGLGGEIILNNSLIGLEYDSNNISKLHFKDKSSTKINRDEEDNAVREILNRVKFGTEGALFTGLIGGVGSTLKALSKRGKDMRFSNSKLDRFYDKVASKVRARGGKTQEFFDIERGQVLSLIHI